MIIDFHTHVFPPKIKNNRNRYVDSDPCFANLYSDPKSKLVTTDELIASMDRAGVDRSVILNINWTIHELCLETNDYILESISRYPQRLVGFCSVQLQSPEVALKEIERCIRGGIKGIGELRPDVQLFDISDKQLIKLLVDMMKKHNLIMLIHASEPVGHLYPGKGIITPEVLYPFIVDNPELTVICSHWGGGLPLYALMPEVKRAIANVYFDTAASPLLYSTQIYKQVVQLIGADKILFGSDYPLLEQDHGFKEVKSSNLPEETINMILSGNALKLLGIN
jgi:predicted TIM-barrel fold metal-dependent hydrolase